MPLSSDQFSVVRSWVGSLPADDDLDEIFDRHFALQSGLSFDEATTKALNLTVEESLRTQMATLVLDRPPRFTLPNGLSVDYGAAITALTEWLKLFRTQGTDGKGQMLVSRLRRYQTR